MQGLLVLTICTVVLGGRLQDLKHDDTCDNVFCAVGTECVDRHGKPECECVQKCRVPEIPVCGSNGTHLKTYKSECHLYMEACLQQDKQAISLVAKMSCEADKKREKELTKEIETNKQKVKPVVCMQKDRNSVRMAIIDWLKQKLNLEFSEISYKGILMKYFSMLDANNDGSLDTMEFMKLMEENESISEILSEDSHSNPILRGMCLSELIAITDENSDYKLEFEEFHKCLNPSFKPPQEQCELDGKVFDDGDDIPQDCNTCKCACGHWVCTQLKCENNVREIFGKAVETTSL